MIIKNLLNLNNLIIHYNPEIQNFLDSHLFPLSFKTFKFIEVLTQYFTIHSEADLSKC